MFVFSKRQMDGRIAAVNITVTSNLNRGYKTRLDTTHAQDYSQDPNDQEIVHVTWPIDRLLLWELSVRD